MARASRTLTGLALLGGVAATVTMVNGRRPAPAAPADCAPAAADCISEDDVGPSPEAPERRVADDVCPNAGYLCRAIDDENRLVVRRWKGFSGTMVVHVPAPDFEEPSTARDLQRAAAAGIRAWNGQPFPVVVDERGTRDADFAVRWTRSLGGNVLGWAETSWSPQSGLSVRRLSLATRSPARGTVITPRQLRLTAAHEMGHALGLGHSDNRRDLMYPVNTATAPSAQDYKTVDALYALPDGLEIVRD